MVDLDEETQNQLFDTLAQWEAYLSTLPLHELGPDEPEKSLEATPAPPGP